MAIALWNHLTPFRTQKWNAAATMVVWQIPCESSSPPGSQIQNPAHWAGFFICVATGGRQGEKGKTGRKQFCVTPVSRLELCERPDKTVRCRLTQTPGMGWAQKRLERFWTAQPARNNVVHRPRIQSRDAFKLTNNCFNGAMPSAIAPRLDLCKSTQIQTNTKS